MNATAYRRAALVLMSAATAWTAVTTATPARAQSRRVDDAWMGRIAAHQLAETVKANPDDTRPLQQQLQAVMLARLACGDLRRLDGLTELVMVYRQARLYDLARSAGGSDLAGWLLGESELARLMARAILDVRRPGVALERLAQLRKAHPDEVAAAPNLAVAFATAEPYRHYQMPKDLATLEESFGYYADPRARFDTDVKSMPYELSRYLAISRLSVAERLWARANFGRLPSPARSYFALDYDMDYYRHGKPKKISKLDYTLPNLRKVGGVCIEQAYFAAEVCRARGVPAVIVYGKSSSGTGHAWVAAARVQGRGRRIRVHWDADTGRYRSQLYYTGYCHEPADNEKVTDEELHLSGWAAGLGQVDRERADAATFLARLAGNRAEDADPPGAEPLRALAKKHDETFPDAPAADVSWIAKPEKVGPDLAADLLDQAIDANLAHKPAWRYLVTLRKQDKIGLDRLEKFLMLLIRRTVRNLPGYSCQVAMEILPSITPAERRIRTYDNACRIYSSRPDLQAKLMIAAGDDLLAQGKTKEALSAYEHAAARGRQLAEVLLLAAGKAEKLLRDADRLDDAIRMYARLFQQSRTQRIAPQFAASTARYRLGLRLAQLLKEAGQDQQAQQVLRSIGAGD